MGPPKTNFFPFSNLGLIIAQQTSIHINCFMAGGGHTSGSPISKIHIVGEGPGETPSALRCLSYLINTFLTDIKQFVKTCNRDTLSAPFWCLCLSLLYFNKTVLHKSSEWSSLVTGPRLNPCPPEAKNPGVFHGSATTFQSFPEATWHRIPHQTSERQTSALRPGSACYTQQVYYCYFKWVNKFFLALVLNAVNIERYNWCKPALFGSSVIF